MKRAGDETVTDECCPPKKHKPDQEQESNMLSDDYLPIVMVCQHLDHQLGLHWGMRGFRHVIQGSKALCNHPDIPITYRYPMLVGTHPSLSAPYHISCCEQGWCNHTSEECIPRRMARARMEMIRAPWFLTPGETLAMRPFSLDVFSLPGDMWAKANQNWNAEATKDKEGKFAFILRNYSTIEGRSLDDPAQICLQRIGWLDIAYSILCDGWGIKDVPLGEEWLTPKKKKDKKDKQIKQVA